MSERQICIPGLRPSCPTIRTPSVARAIAERLVRAVNLDDFYWTQADLPERIEDVTREIVQHGQVASVFDRLARCERSRELDSNAYGWEGISEHCRHIAGDIAEEELVKSRLEWQGLEEVTWER